MRAITQHAFGAPDVLEVADVAKPAPLPSEVLVRVHAASINRVDTYVRSGALPLLGEPPFILGWDISGVVEEVVPGVTRFDIGDEVFGMPFFPRAGSAFAEYVAVPSRQLARKPANLSHVEAASIPLAGLTARQSLIDTAHITEGDRVLIHAGAGGVGHFAIQIAKAAGAHVITTAGAAKHDFVKSLGADEVIDYHTTDCTGHLRDLDVVLDTVGGYGDAAIATLKPGGRFITIVERTDLDLAHRVTAAGRRFAGVTVEPDYAGLERLAALAADGALRPHIQQTFPLEEAAKAHELVESGRTVGKIVLTMSN
ncbi:NADP-dependent oxidoreductase [Nocardia sp. 004]|uniref:NADP-dependent oxidoreductase n=1 Tax=Nocardia sp. 004 TaxID=3385978 RepID=UPI0039A03169